MCFKDNYTAGLPGNIFSAYMLVFAGRVLCEPPLLVLTMCVTLSTAARQTRRGGCDTVMDCPAVTRSHIENTATAGAGCEQVSQRCNVLSFSLPANQFICVCVCVSIIRRRMKL